MQKQKNIRLLISLSIIILLIALIPFLKESRDGFSFDKNQFTLNDQAVITDVILISESARNKLSFENGTWQVNSTYQLDPNMRDVFFSVLSKLQIRRAVSEAQNDSISSLSKKHGIQVTILNNQDIIKNYWIRGDNESQTSYLTDESAQSYIVHIPGYRSYVAGIFEVPENDWRTRRVFSALFTNLNSLKINFSNEEIEFHYKDSFFEISGIKADSTQLITSLERLLFLQTDQFLQPSEILKYIDDDFSYDNPSISILVTKISGAEETVKVFDTEEEYSFYLGITPDSSYCLFNKKRLNKILVKMSDFQ